jgi:hypothetical protein
MLYLPLAAAPPRHSLPRRSGVRIRDFKNCKTVLLFAPKTDEFFGPVFLKKIKKNTNTL